MMATAQHKATSAITSVEEQKPVQQYLMLSVREGTGAAPFCNCRFTRQDPTAYPSSEVRCLRDKCIKLASRSCLGKRTVSRNHAILARDFKGNKQLAKKGTVPFKKTQEAPCANIGGSAPPLQIIDNAMRKC